MAGTSGFAVGVAVPGVDCRFAYSVSSRAGYTGNMAETSPSVSAEEALLYRDMEEVLQRHAAIVSISGVSDVESALVERPPTLVVLTGRLACCAPYVRNPVLGIVQGIWPDSGGQPAGWLYFGGERLGERIELLVKSTPVGSRWHALGLPRLKAEEADDCRAALKRAEWSTDLSAVMAERLRFVATAAQLFDGRDPGRSG